MFLEYGVPSCDKGTNQPNVFYAPTRSRASRPTGRSGIRTQAGGSIPLRDDTISALGLQAIYDYWVTAATTKRSAASSMLQFAFSCVWNWDARPFPVFPILGSEWGDAGNWQAGNWINGRGPALPPVAPSPPPIAGDLSDLSGAGDSRLVDAREAAVCN